MTTQQEAFREEITKKKVELVDLIATCNQNITDWQDSIKQLMGRIADENDKKTKAQLALKELRSTFTWLSTVQGG